MPQRIARNMLRQVPGGIAAPCGFEAAGVRCGLKRRGPDLALIYTAAPAIAAVYRRAAAFARDRLRS